MVDAATCSDTVLSRADIRRRKLVETARSLFIENGFHATGIAQVAQQSGIAVGQIYRDFSSKEEIVAVLVQEDCGRFMDSATLEAAIAAGDKHAVLAWLYHFVHPVGDIGPDRMFAEIVAESSRNPRIAAIFTALQDDLRGQILSALALLAPEKSRAAAREVTADAIITLSLGVMQHRLLRPDIKVAPLSKALQGLISHWIDTLEGPRHRCGADGNVSATGMQR